MNGVCGLRSVVVSLWLGWIDRVCVRVRFSVLLLPLLLRPLVPAAAARRCWLFAAAAAAAVWLFPLTVAKSPRAARDPRQEKRRRTKRKRKEKKASKQQAAAAEQSSSQASQRWNRGHGQQSLFESAQAARLVLISTQCTHPLQLPRLPQGRIVVVCLPSALPGCRRC